jgi:cholesterol oxidase
MFYERERPGIEFTEQMSGNFGWVPGPPPRPPVDSAKPWRRAVRPPATTHKLTMNLTIIADDVEALVSRRDHAARLVGTVTAPALSAQPLQIRNGHFHLFLLDNDRVETRVLRYRMSVDARTNGQLRTYRIRGEKVARNAVGSKLWRDLSTLYVTIASKDGARVGLGILHLSVGDFLRQLTTIRARHTQGVGERFDVHANLLRYFVGMLRSLYGRVLAQATLSTLDASPQPRRRQMRPSTYQVVTSDGTVIHLSRHRGGEFGPVLLSPGFSVRANSFAADTVPKNLVEYLVSEKYDVWLLDYRASSGFAAAGTEFSIDDVAVRDYPAAVDTIRCESGREKIQVVAHCVGSMALLMSLLAGKLQGKLESVVCSQLGLHPIAPTFAEFKAAVGAASFLRRFGVRRLTAQYDPYSLAHRLLDRLLILYPTRERCNNPTCRRILLLLGESFRHAQLNTATHDSMQEWFGTTSIPALAHLALMLRIGHVVDKDGRDTYLPHLERLAVPISFIHGARNREFLPAATRKTYQLLCRTNGEHWYKRYVIPKYGHMDCFIGKNAATDVFPLILKRLQAGRRRG